MTQEISSSLMGKTMPEIGEALFPNMTEEERMGIVNDFGNEEVKYLSEHGANVFDGVEETLSELEKDYDLYVGSCRHNVNKRYGTSTGRNLYKNRG